MNTHEIDILKELSSQYMEAADLPIHKEKIDLWKALNKNEMKRPMVAIDQLPWHELNTNGELNCYVKDPFWRGVEYSMRQSLYKWNHFPADMVLEPCIVIPKAITSTDYGIAIDEDILSIDIANDIVSHRYINQLQTEEDIYKIHDMTFTHDEKQSSLRLEQAKEIFSGIAPVRQSSGIQFNLAVWDKLSMFMGVEDIYCDLLIRPEFIHKLLERITDATIAGIESANRLMIHDDNALTCHCSYIFTDSLFPFPGSGSGSISINSWAFGMAQLFTSVSPEITKEFEIPYISRMAEYFGMLYYGCCDRLDDRLELVKEIKNVRKISCSPWSDVKVFSEKIGDKHIMSLKPSPAYLAVEHVDSDIIKKDILIALDFAKQNDVNIEIILKDVSTLRYNPQRLTDWTDLVMRIVQS